MRGPLDFLLFCSRHCSTSDQRSRYSGSPYSNGWDATLQSLSQKKNLNSYQYTLGDDGLIPLRSVVQERLDQIIEEQKVRQAVTGSAIPKFKLENSYNFFVFAEEGGPVGKGTARDEAEPHKAIVSQVQPHGRRTAGR